MNPFQLFILSCEIETYVNYAGLQFSSHLRRSEGSKIPKVELTISIDGVAIQEPKTKAGGTYTLMCTLLVVNVARTQYNWFRCYRGFCTSIRCIGSHIVRMTRLRSDFSALLLKRRIQRNNINIDALFLLVIDW